MEYQIGEFSKIVKMSIKTLRFYHEKGLLEPSYIDEETNYRYYNESSIEKAKVINELKALNFSLTDIKEIMQNYNDDFDIIPYMKKKSEEIKKKITDFKKVEKKLEAFIKQEEYVKKIEQIKFNIEIKDIPDTLIAGIRFIGKYQDIGKYIGKLYKTCGRYVCGSPFSLYREMEYKEDNADIEICLPINKDISDNEVSSRTLKGGKAITFIHKGTYEMVGNAYKKLIDYKNEHNLEIQIPTREKYIKGPGRIFYGNPKNFITELQFIY